jgi:ABC-type nitrate/sulfonate/bicarbonate transport system substrate-binding protein
MPERSPLGNRGAAVVARKMERAMSQKDAAMRVGFAIPATALMVALAAPPAPAQNLKTQDLKIWRQAMIAPKADSGFFLMAARRGFAEREGLKIEVVDVKDDQVGMRALISGQVDSFDSATGGVVAATRGADVKFVGCPWLTVPYVILARAGITKMDGLRGKTLAASSPGTPPDIVARASLAAFKVPDQDIKFAAVGGDRDRYSALLGGIVDAAVVANEYTPMPSSKGLNLLVEAKQVLPQWVRFCTLINGQALTLRREEAVRFLSAEIKAFRFAVSHRADTIKLTQEITDAAPDDPRPAYVFDEGVKPGVVAPDFPIPLESLEWMRNKLVELGQIPNTDLAKAVDAQLRVQALERIGK